MNKTTRIIIVIAVVAVAALAFVAGQHKTTKPTAPGESAVTVTLAKPTEANASPAIATKTAKLPRLVDLGAGKCIPCKMMAPILQELKKEYAGRMNVEFIDVWVNPDAGKPYGIEVIPTQIFFDSSGKELFRHIGFFSKDDILAKWKELGVDLTGKSSPGTSPGSASNAKKS
jgi:thioredoxin 1